MDRRLFVSLVVAAAAGGPLVSYAKKKKGKGGSRVNKGPTGDGAKSYAGKIEVVNTVQRVVVVKGKAGSRSFHVGSSCYIVTRGKPRGSIRDLKVGDKVSVRESHGMGGRFNATAITVK